MHYKTYFNFYTHYGEAKIYENNNLPVAALAVRGGAARLINFHATDDISLVSELEQARTFKNMILYLSATKDHKDMKAALDLRSISSEERPIKMLIIIERFSGGKLLEGLGFYTRYARLVSPPVMTIDNTLMASLRFETSEIYRGHIQKHQMPEVLEI